MTKIKELLNQYCCEGVEYVKLSDIAKIVRGERVTKSQLSEDNEYPVFQNSLVPLGYYSKYNCKAGVPFVISAGAAGEIGICDYEFWAADDCLVIMGNRELDNNYLYHVLLMNMRYLKSKVRKASVPRLSKSIIEGLEIPLPALPVQREIARILGEFSLLSAELAAELAARQQQYKYYRDYLLDINRFKENEIKYVGELFEIKNGLNKEKSAFGKGTPIVNFTDVFKRRYLTKDAIKGLVTLSNAELERYKVEKGDVFFTRTSETKEEVGMSSTIIEDIDNCTFSGFVLRARPLTNLLLPKFCSYYFSTTQVRNNIIRYASFTTRATTSGPKLSKIPVPIIPLEEQKRIVNILDNFESVISDINYGLPAEIEARQKQYEYYRDKLLSFKRK